jgi:hypothetical protein
MAVIKPDATLINSIFIESNKDNIQQNEMAQTVPSLVFYFVSGTDSSQTIMEFLKEFQSHMICPV